MKVCPMMLAVLVGKTYANTCSGPDMHQTQCSLPSTDISYKTGVWSHAACCENCQNFPGCKAWSWEFSEGHCHLHTSCSKISNPRYHAGIMGDSPSPPGPPPPGPPGPPPPGPPSGGSTSIVTFHWNSHYQCNDDERCRLAAVKRFGELVHESGAQIATGIELRGASTALNGWSHSKEYEDSVSIMVAPGWTVHKTGGGQIESGSGQRGVAVMLVTPPHTVSGCPQLCVLGVHPGHDTITRGKYIVDDVCGSLADHCAIAMGDWNFGAAEVRGGSVRSWSRLIGGTLSVLAPDVSTCCNKRSGYHNFDHVGTNIRGATESTYKVYPYQLTDSFSMTEEHMPVSVHINLPTETVVV